MRQKNRRLRDCAGGESKFNPPGGLSVHVPTLRKPRTACPERSRRGGATSIGKCLLVGQPAEGWVFRTNPLSAAALSKPAHPFAENAKGWGTRTRLSHPSNLR